MPLYLRNKKQLKVAGAVLLVCLLVSQTEEPWKFDEASNSAILAEGKVGLQDWVDSLGESKK